MVNGIMTQIDLNPVIAKVDEPLMAQIDIDQLLDVDVNSLMERTDLGPIITPARAPVVSEAIDGVRSAGVGLDSFVHRWADRVFRRPAGRRSGPPLLVSNEERAPA
jgi:hypothetical protein